ncbi:LysE family translocator [Desulfospira joergensenii]|uniref:LysE family translocator n=1 Tax=Desulfospira joergensenii TaxID=53329 RepID=UPI0003B75AE0|nr:LysE family translocator [Desulfospira joergensenii]
MEGSTWFIFFGLALVGVISPGPAVLLAVTNGIRYGFKTSLYSSLGNITGLLIVSGSAVLGLGAVLKTSALLFALLKTLGAFYLIYLGIRQWFSNADWPNLEDPDHPPVQERRKTFLQGLFVALSNPKAILFFTALFPQFLDLSRPVPLQFAILTSTFMVLSFLALAVYAKSAHSLKAWLTDGRRIPWFNRISGTVFISFGLGILFMKTEKA